MPIFRVIASEAKQSSPSAHRIAWLDCRVAALLAMTILFVVGIASAASLSFPSLNGNPVVDDAHVLSASTISDLNYKLTSYSDGTGNQVAVVTLPSLQGDSIEDYSNLLYRKWALGQKGKDNGVLLAVAPHERKVHIEVGYGLEPVLTDAMASEIIHGIILPAFKAGDIDRGVREGAYAIVTTLGGSGVPLHTVQHQNSTVDTVLAFIMLGLLLYCFVTDPVGMISAVALSRFSGSSYGNSGWSGGGGFGGGFSGGGGSAGGGGASGSW